VTAATATNAFISVV